MWVSDKGKESWPISGPVPITGYRRWKWECRWCGETTHTESRFRGQVIQDTQQHVFEICLSKPSGFRWVKENK